MGRGFPLQAVYKAWPCQASLPFFYLLDKEKHAIPPRVHTSGQTRELQTSVITLAHSVYHLGRGFPLQAVYEAWPCQASLQFFHQLQHCVSVAASPCQPAATPPLPQTDSYCCVATVQVPRRVKGHPHSHWWVTWTCVDQVMLLLPHETSVVQCSSMGRLGWGQFMIIICSNLMGSKTEMMLMLGFYFTI